MDHSKFDRIFTKNVPHILEKIFFSLDYQTYKACSEVCQAWKDTLSSEHFILRATKLLTKNDRRLIRASGEGNLANVRRILSECMVDVNNERQSYRSRSLYMAMDKGHLELGKLLLDAGADPNQEDEQGRTFIHHAVNRDRKYYVQMLLERGADPNKGDKCGFTPLHEASRLEEKEMVKLLLEGGAEVDKTNRIGSTPLWLAAFMPHFEAISVIKILLDYGANPNKANLMGRTPLHHPSALGCIEVVQALLEGGADPRKKDNRGRNSLWMASRAKSKAKSKAIIRLFKEAENGHLNHHA